MRVLAHGFCSEQWTAPPPVDLMGVSRTPVRGSSQWAMTTATTSLEPMHVGFVVMQT